MIALPNEAFQDVIDRKRKARMETIDQLPSDVRQLVHVYGFTVVNAFLQVGVIKPNRIRHVVETVLDEFSPTRGSFSCQGIRTPLITEADINVASTASGGRDDG